MITLPTYNKIQDILIYTGTAPGVSASAPKSGDVHGNNAWLVNLGEVDPAVSFPVSKELTIAVKVPSHTKIKSAKVLQVNGRIGHVYGDAYLKAGVEAAYTMNAVAGVASSVATTEIPKADFYTTLDIPTYDGTDEEYQFLKLQLQAVPTAATWDITKSINPTGYLLLDIAVCFEEKYANIGPGGPAEDLYMNKTNTEVWVKWNNSLQLIGCLQNAFELAFGIEFSTIMKGATESPVAVSIASRDNMVTGLQSYGFGNWLVNQITKGNLIVTSDGEWTQNTIDYGWKKISGVEFWLRTHNHLGQDDIIKFPRAYIEPNGNRPMGTAEATLPFNIHSLAQVEERWSNSAWDHAYVAVYGTIA